MGADAPARVRPRFDGDPHAAVMPAMLKMSKLDIAALAQSGDEGGKP